MMENWLSESLTSILEFPVPEDLIKYILAIENTNELEEYMKTLINFNDPRHRGFYNELVKKMAPQRGPPTQQHARQKKKNVKNKQEQVIVKETETNEKDKENSPAANAAKKKTKYVNLYSQDGQNAQVVFLKGRHHCDCQATKHSLINNCINCGRIVCKQEGSGPCLFCGNLVCTAEEQREINSKTKASAKLMETLMEKSRPKGWEAAVTQRNRLLEYDRTSEQRTRVTDDDSDYFSTSSVWLSATEREKLQKYQTSLFEKKHASRLQKKMTFDFAGRQILEDNTIDHEVDENKIMEITSASPSNQQNFMIGAPSDRDVAPGVNAPLLEFDDTVPSNAHSNNQMGNIHTYASRVQDLEIQEMVDAGRCLSMHQPWASLLVEGIKMHEGRSWYTSHRGRLWIASTVKPPDAETVKMLENMYKSQYPDKEHKFPSFYPTGCLLGCVNVDECLPQEEYDKIYPNGESDSPYVFICSNPMSLRLRFPVKGQHKIYVLDKTIHQAAVKCMQKMGKMQSDAAG